MATEITKPQGSNEQIATWKRSYLAAWERAFNEIMFLIADQYGLELLIEVGGKKVPSPTVKFWREELEHLSPEQMREALKSYMRSERAGFKPTPGMIRDNAPERATDRPHKVKNPECPDCRGSGYRMVQVDSKIHPGKKTKRVTDCYCVHIEYNGESYIPEQRQLPSTLDSARVKDLQDKIDAAAKGKAIPQNRQQTDAEYNARQQELQRQAKELEKKHAK